MSLSTGHDKVATRFSFSGRLKRNASFKVGVVIIGIYLVISLLDVAYPKYINVSNAFNLFAFTNPGLKSVVLTQPSPPTLNHGWMYIFGTTAYEIPILPAILASIPIDLGYAVLIAGVSAVIGTLIGVTGAFFSRESEWLISVISNAFISFPLIISVVIFGFLFHFTILSIFAGIVVVLWAYYAQITRMLTLNVKAKQFIEAARASGASDLRIVYSHIVPNITTPILIRLSLDMATVVLIFSAANFMFWAQFLPLATIPELGSLINGFPEFGYQFGYPIGGPVMGGGHYIPATAAVFLYLGYWWTVLFPILFLLVLVIGLIALSDGLRKAMDPRTT